MITKAFVIIIFICYKFFTVANSIVLRTSFHCKNFRIDSAQLESNSAGDKTIFIRPSQLRVSLELKTNIQLFILFFVLRIKKLTELTSLTYVAVCAAQNRSVRIITT